MDGMGWTVGIDGTVIQVFQFLCYVFEVGMLLTHVVHTNQRDWVLRFAAGRQAVVCVPNYGVTNG